MLAEHPGLERWHAAKRTAPQMSLDNAEKLLLVTCESLAAGPAHALRTWVEGFQRFLRDAQAPLAEFLKAETIAQEHDADLLEILSEFGETAARGDVGQAFLTAIRAGAEATGLVALRFLSAWMALNVGALEDCVADCDEVQQPYAAILTIQGQAYNELARPQEALGVLQTAVKLSPNEILAWFQLAKAHHLLDETAAAWEALGECQRLAPQNPEVALFMSMVALGKGGDWAMHRRAFQELRPHFPLFRGNADVLFALLNLCLKREAEADCAGILSEANWDAIKIDRTLVKHLPDTLRGLNERSWHNVAKELLTRLTQPVAVAG
jgi:tetratricopeptide (TPR) repeat protein